MGDWAWRLCNPALGHYRCDVLELQLRISWNDHRRTTNCFQEPQHFNITLLNSQNLPLLIVSHYLQSHKTDRSHVVSRPNTASDRPD